MNNKQKTIGIFALQGAFIEHQKKMEELGAKCFLIRSLSDVNRKIDGIIIPGGESTTMMKMLQKTNLDKWLIDEAKKGIPIFGTCAGMIILSELKLIDIEIERNAYGSQLNSFEDDIQNSTLDIGCSIFIRAPKISKIGKNIKILARHNKIPVLIQQKNILTTSFHPELTNNLDIHRYFLDLNPAHNPK